MNQTRTVVVTGATGAVGPAVVRALQEAGFRVKTFSFDVPHPGDLPATVDVVRGDINDYSAVREVLRGADVVVHMAALLHIDNPSPVLQARYNLINVDGTRSVTQASAEQGVKRLVFFSTINVYGPTSGCMATEETPLKPDSFYAQTKKAGEAIVLGAKAENGEAIGTVLRLGAVYGSRVKGNYRRLAQTLAKGRALPLAGRNRRTVVYDQDVGRAVCSVVDTPEAAGKVYNVTDGKIHTVQDIFRAISLAAGPTAPRFFLPVLPVRLAGAIGKTLLSALRLPLPTPLVLLEKYFEDIAVDGSKIQRETPFRPVYDLQRGWQETIRLMREAGDL